MIRKSTACRHARRDILRGSLLGAADRSRLELHLRQCEDCRRLAEGFAAVESGPGGIVPPSEERIRAIHDRLIPVAHELSSRAAAPAPRRPFLMLIPTALAAVLLAVLATSFLAGPDPGPAGPRARSGPPAAAPVASPPAVLDGSIDLGAGAVSIDGREPTEIGERFPVRAGTTIELEPAGRFGFRLGGGIRVALSGETVFRVSGITGSLVELELDLGRMAVEFDGGQGAHLDVRTPDSLVRVRGTVFTVEVFPDRTSRVAVVDGRVAVTPVGISGREVEVASGGMLELPGYVVSTLGAEQRALAADLVPAVDDDRSPAGGGRLVRFAGSPERVLVEVEGRVIGITPLTVRLPEGRLAYRLVAPGMESLAGQLEEHRRESQVDFELAPAADYRDEAAPTRAARTSARRVSAGSVATPADTGVRWDLRRRARAAMTAGNIPYAIELLERVVAGSAGAELISALSMLADCHAAVGSYAEAARTFDRIVALAPGSEAAQNSRYEVGRLAADRLGDNARARTAYTSYLASPVGGPLREDAYLALCKLDGREARHREALHCFGEMLRVFPGGHHEAEARLWRGALIQDVEKRWGEAERDLLWFLEARPGHPRTEEARYRVALGRYHAGDRSGALRMISEYLREHPGGLYEVRIERLRRAALAPAAPRPRSTD